MKKRKRQKEFQRLVTMKKWSCLLIFVMLSFGQRLTAQTQSDTISYWMEYNFDYPDLNDYDSIWNVRCFIKIPEGVTVKKFHFKIADTSQDYYIVYNANSPNLENISIGTIGDNVYTTLHPKRPETTYTPTFIKENNVIVADFGFHKSRHYDVEFKPIDVQDNDYKKVKKENDVKY